MSSDEQKRALVSLYIQRLKAHFAVRTDEELAGILKMSKQNLANWRRRGTVPDKLTARMYNEYGLFWQELVENPATETIANAVHGAAIQVMVRNGYVPGVNATSEEWLRAGRALTATLEMLREVEPAQAVRHSATDLLDALAGNRMVNAAARVMWTSATDVPQSADFATRTPLKPPQ